MQYLLLIHVDEKAMQAATPEQTAATLAAYGAYTKAMIGRRREQGPASACARPRPRPRCASRTARPRCSTAPTPRSKSSWAATILIDAPDLDAAISWAARCPGAQHGAIEVRPIWEM